MKNSFLLRIGLFFGLLLTAGVAFAQTGDLPPLPTPEDGVDKYVVWADIVYGALVMITGWLSVYIPGIRNIPDKAWRIAAIALVGGGIFVVMGWANGLTLFITYLITTKVYELFVKKVAPTPDTKKDIIRKEKALEQSKTELKQAA